MRKHFIKTTIFIATLFLSITGCNSKKESKGGDITPVAVDETPLRLWYDEETQKLNEGSSKATMAGGGDLGWERWSLPLGNGYFGANVFGRTETERIQITEKTLSNPWRIYDKNWKEVEIGGLNNFSETYIDFHHLNSNVNNYYRYLDVNTAISGVSYDYEGVNYSREYFTSYPDKALVISLTSDTDGALDFILRPTIPYKQSFAVFKGDGVTKEGQVTSYIKNGVGCVELSGKLGYYDVDFLGLYRVYVDNGSVVASSETNRYKDNDGTYYEDNNGTIKVSGANNALIVVTLGTDYELSSELFTSSDRFKPTTLTTLDDARNKVQGYMDSILNVIDGQPVSGAYRILKERHLNDYKSLYDRVSFELDYDKKELELTTDQLLRSYQTGNYSSYLEMLLFQYSRYLLISSSRPGALPANLQGTWNTYNTPPWSSGYWHNINVQMNYWSSFSTNLAETFIPYIDFNNAYMKQAEANASTLVFQNNKSVYGKDGGNGWTIGVANNPFFINSDRSSGNMGFTTQLYWDYYQYTKDKEVLKMVYDVLANAARYVTKCVKEDKDGHYLVESSDSPEQYVDGRWYYTTGTTYAQSFSYLNNYYTLLAAKELGVDLTDETVLSKNEYSILKTILEQIDKYDPINVGLSGQIKEFREEDYYGSLGDPGHRHISQLVGLCPGNLINSQTPAWLDAAKVSLAGRDGENMMGPPLEQVGWSFVHRMGCYARCKDGEMAHTMLHDLIDKQMTTNLLTFCGNVFQIEAILGTSSTMAETLLQSHEGYIDLFPALPKKWKSGSFKGLVTRGNYEIDAKWANNHVEEVNILSKSGEEIKLSYPSIQSVKVVDDLGKTIDYSVINNNMISFQTEVGRTYKIIDFAHQNKPNKPTNFNFKRQDLESFNFSWDKVDDAISYKIYKAVDNNPEYTLVGSSLNNQFSYKPIQSEINKRTTFAVVAVDAKKRESDRATCFYNPIEADAYINDVVWNVLENGQMQVNVFANDKASSFKLYEKKNNSLFYDVVQESNSPLLNGVTYNSQSIYAVTAVSKYSHEETEKYLLNRNITSNVVLGKQFVPTEEAAKSVYNNSFDYNCLTDGIFEANNGRFSTVVGGLMDGTVDLGGHYSLSELRLYVYDSNNNYAGKSLSIDGYINGNWKTIYKINSVNEFSKFRVGNYLSFDLSNLVFEKIRVSSPKSIDGYSISFHELECYGFKVDGRFNEKDGDVLLSPNASIECDNPCSDLNNMIDGNYDNYANVASENGSYSVDISLTIPRELFTLEIYENVVGGITSSNKTTIEVLFNGEWICIDKDVSLDASGQTSFNLYGVMASKIRISFANENYEFDGKTAMIKEISCTSAGLSPFTTGSFYGDWRND